MRSSKFCANDTNFIRRFHSQSGKWNNADAVWSPIQNRPHPRGWRHILRLVASRCSSAPPGWTCSLPASSTGQEHIRMSGDFLWDRAAVPASGRCPFDLTSMLAPPRCSRSPQSSVVYLLGHATRFSGKLVIMNRACLAEDPHPFEEIARPTNVLVPITRPHMQHNDTLTGPREWHRNSPRT